jgi:hypothetical protein
LLPAITSGNYYTFNVLESAGDNASQILETTYQPVSLVSQTLVAPITTNNGAFLTVTASAAPNASEYVYVRYSTDGFVTSAIVPVIFNGVTGTTNLPCYAGGTNVSYYYFSTNKTIIQLNSDAVTYGQATAYDLATLSLLNNGGSNYSYSQPFNNNFEGTYYVPSPCYPNLASFITAINAGFVANNVIVNVSAGYTETAPIGGFRLTANGGVSSRSITFQKNGVGANPTFTASGSLTAGVLYDAIFKIIGSDFVTVDGFTFLENPANTTTAAATNNMIEFGIALSYANASDGAQNITLKNNTIDLNKTYQNTFGIYSNNTHAETTVTVSAGSLATQGSNANLKIANNNITDVNMGIVVIGSGGTGDHNDGLIIGGSSTEGNTITNFGTTGTFSGYTNVSGTVNGVIIRNTKNFNISYNTITSSNGGVTLTGNIRGIFINSFSNAPLGTFTNSINNNTISITGGNIGNTLSGIVSESGTGSVSSTLNINDNVFYTFNFVPAAATGSVNIINNAQACLTSNINNNKFSNVTVNSAGSVTFINNSNSLASGSTKNVNGNSIITAFNKNIAGGTVTFYQDAGLSINGSFVNNLNNDFSNVTTIGSTIIAGWNNQDGGAGSNSTKIITGNLFSSITSGTGNINVLDVNGFGGSTSAVSNNSITSITTGGAGILTGLRLGVNSTANPLEVRNNVILGLNSGTGATTGIICNSPATNINVDANQVRNVLSAGTVIGIQSANSAATINIINSNIDNLKSSGTTSNVSGISNTVTAIINIQTNAIRNLELTNTSATASLRGINCASASISAIPAITNNTIELLTSASTSNSVTVAGINVSGSANYNVSTNTVRNITANSTNTGSGGSTSLIGIVTGSSGSTQKINNNTIYAISSNNTSVSDVKVAAIVNSSSLAGSEILKNKIYDINNLATGTISPIIAGFYNSGGGTWTVANNMISLSNGSNTNGIQCLGVFDNGSSGARSYYYNSIHIGGNSASALSSIAFQYNKGAGTVNIKNNICQNVRAGGGKNYAIANTAAAGFAGLTFSNNILFSTNPSTIGLVAPAVDRDFTAWTTSSSGPDSFSSLTTFVNPSIGDLHIDATTCSDAKGTATPLAAVLDDFDVFTRDIATPDIGADEHIKTSTIWNGTVWTPSAPTSSSLAIIEGDYDMTLGVTRPSIDACSLIIRNNAKVTVSPAKYLNLENNLTVANNALLEVQNGGSFIQVSNNGKNTTGTTATVSNFSLKRDTNIRELDYVYWSAPVALFPVANISSATPLSKIWNWNTIVVNPNGGQGNWENVSEDMIAGKGYIVRGPAGWNPTTPTTYSATFLGKPNNGVYTPAIQRGSITTPTTTGNNGVVYSNFADNWNLIGNPYPSSIKVSDFLTANTNIEGAVRIWTHGALPVSPTNPFYNTFVYNYTPADYIVYNGTATTSGPAGFNGFIAAGQGFFVVMNDGAATSAPLPTVTFNNSMRSKLYNNSQFYRNANQKNTANFDNIEKHRIWLDIVSQTGEIARTVVGYVAGATQEKDRIFDAYSSYQPELNIFSLINEEIMTIQGRSLPFENTDAVPMGIKVPTNGTYTIAINAVDGLFANNGQTIYLEDKLTNTIHNLSITPYQFNVNQGLSNDRFVLRYTDAALANPDFEALSNSVSVYASSNVIKINSSIENIKNYQIYDVLGRTLATGETINNKQIDVTSILKNNQALIIKTTLENGQVVTKKIVF